MKFVYFLQYRLADNFEWKTLSSLDLPSSRTETTTVTVTNGERSTDTKWRVPSYLSMEDDGYQLRFFVHAVELNFPSSVQLQTVHKTEIFHINSLSNPKARGCWTNDVFTVYVENIHTKEYTGTIISKIAVVVPPLSCNFVRDGLPDAFKKKRGGEEDLSLECDALDGPPMSVTHFCQLVEEMHEKVQALDQDMKKIKQWIKDQLVNK